MNFLRNLFGGGQSGGDGDKDGIYFYVRSNHSDEIIRLRLHRGNDLTLMDDGSGFFVRKVMVGQKSFNRIEGEFYFDRNRRFRSADLTGGELVEQADYDAYVAAQESAHADTAPDGDPNQPDES